MMKTGERFHHHSMFTGPPLEILGTAALVMLPMAIALVAAAWTGYDPLGLLGVLLTWLLAALVMRYHGLTWSNLGLGRRLFWRGVQAAVPVTLFLLAMGVGVNWVLTRFLGWQPDLSAFEILKGDPKILASMLLIAWTTAAFGEEMIFRAFLMRSMRDADAQRRWWPAVLISSVLFGAAHFYQGAAGMLMTGLIGAVLAVAYLRTGRNLWVAVMAHGFYDTIGLVMVYLGESEFV